MQRTRSIRDRDRGGGRRSARTLALAGKTVTRPVEYINDSELLGAKGNYCCFVGREASK